MSLRPADRTLVYSSARYLAAFLLLLYGFAKIMGAQFTVLDSELDKPLREVSGFWLTWYYFSFSSGYGTIVALIQVGGAIGLMIRRAALLAACALLPVVGNIVLINIFYAIDPGAFVVSLVIVCCLGVVVAAHRQRLMQLVLPTDPESRERPAVKVLTKIVRVAVVVLPLTFTYYVANFNNRRPTPIDGTWTVTRSGAAEAGLPTHIYFERNRAFMCVFRYAHGSSVHHFEVDRARSRVRIWAVWLTRGQLLFEGKFDDARRIVLTGRLPRTGQPVTLQLIRLRPSRVAG